MSGNRSRYPAADVAVDAVSQKPVSITAVPFPLSARVSIAAVPPSINTNAVRSHWRGFQSAKKQWQADLEKLLMAANLPRPLGADGPVLADVVLTFPDRRRRDSENFRPVLSKALGDALVNGGWLRDDTDADWRLQVVIATERGPHQTEVTLSWAAA